MNKRLLSLVAVSLGWSSLPLVSQAQTLAIRGVSPAPGALNVPLTAPVWASFSQVLSPDVATRNVLSVFSQQAGGHKAGQASVSGNRLTFTPTTAFRAGETVFATVGTGATGINSEVLTSTYAFQFTTATVPSAGTFGGGSEVATGNTPTDLAVGDVDGDGRLDMLVAGSGTVAIRLNNGQGSFRDAGLVPLFFGGNVQALTLGDLDNDGDLDLAAVSNDARLTVGYNNGQGTFSAGPTITLHRLPNKVVLADVDGDGRLDIITASSDGTVSVWRNNGLPQGTFIGGATLSTSGSPISVAIGDVDGDGDLDLLTGNTNNTVSVHFNDGQGSFDQLKNGVELAANSPSKVALGDVDGDGDLDLVVANGLNRDNNTVTLHRNDGQGTFGSGSVIPLSAAPLDMVLGDVDGDGDLDLATANYDYNNPAISVRLNNGQGAFSAGTSVAVGVNPVSLTLADVDGSGTLDLVTANQFSYSASVRLNSGRVTGGSPGATLARLHAGGGELTTSQGLFAADQYYSPTPGNVYSTTANIAGTSDPALYQTERYSTNGRLSYALPLPTGTYSVVLHFAELYWQHAGQRLFDVSLEGRKVLDDYDIVRKVGPLTATTETFSVTVSDGVLNLDFSALASDGGIDQAKISAIEVLPATSSSYRLNSGSTDLTTSQGLFAADQYYSPTPGNVYSTTANIAGTSDPALYQTERYSTNGRLSYALPLPTGTYSVVLHFAELYWQHAGQRLFDVSLEGRKVLDDYDIVRKVGPLTATTETFSVTVSDGVLNLDFSALASDGGIDQAKISAIEVAQTTSSSRLAAPATVALPADKAPVSLEAMSLYPNPATATDHVTLSCQVATAQEATGTLTNVLGRLVQQQTLPLQAGYNTVSMPVGQAAPGVYQFTLRLADGQRQQQKLVLQP